MLKKKKKNTWILEMEEVSGSIIYLPGISKQICLSSPPLYSWEFHGLSYTCLGSFHSHRPEEQSSPNPQFSFFNSIFLRLLQNSPFITPLPLAQPPFCIPNIFPSYWLSPIWVAPRSCTLAPKFSEILNMYAECTYISYSAAVKDLHMGGEETIGHNGYDPWLWKKRLGSNPIPSLTS